MEHHNSFKVTGHTGAILDIKWNPFNDNIIASSSDDASVKLWYIPDGGLTANLTECLVQLTGHKRRVGFVEWHPTADNILASVGFDYTVRFLKKKNLFRDAVVDNAYFSFSYEFRFF